MRSNITSGTTNKCGEIPSCIPADLSGWFGQVVSWIINIFGQKIHGISCMGVNRNIDLSVKEKHEKNSYDNGRRIRNPCRWMV